MCLAVPMQIESIDGFQCICAARGIKREVSLSIISLSTHLRMALRLGKY